MRPCSIVSLAAVAISLSAVFTAPLLSQQHRLIAKHVPDIVTSGRAHAIGQTGTSTNLQVAISLPLRNERELDTLIQKLYDPASPLYHHYLSVDQFTQRFQPTESDYRAVVAWAQNNGLKVTDTPSNRRLVAVEGSVGSINRAFNVSLTNYTNDSSGRVFFAPDREPTVDLPVQLFAVSGLDNATPPRSHLRKVGLFGAPFVKPSPVTASTSYGSGPGGTFVPSDLRAAYYGSGSLTGTGQTVGIFSFDGYFASDLQQYYEWISMTSNVPVTNVLVNGYNGDCVDADDPSGPCDDGEQILDIANVIGMAPGLSEVIFYEGTSSTNVLNRMATDDVKVITSSWSGGDFGEASDPAFLEFKAQGQTYLNASGDDASYNSNVGCELDTTGSYCPPDLDSNITQVGGTHLNTLSAGGAWSSESAWPDSGGGYIAGTYAIPPYQQTSGVITSLNGGSTTLRNSPDVAAEADADNTTVDNMQDEDASGTSYAAPRWAGLIALANQQSAGNCGGQSAGFLNPVIYPILGTSSYSSDFHDINSGSNGGFTAVTGYDLVTGLGSPIGPALINTLAPVQVSPPATAVGSISFNQGESTTFSTSVTANDLPVSSGSVAFALCGQTGSNCRPLCSGNMNANGQMSCEWFVNDIGDGTEYLLTATYTGTSSCQNSSAREDVLGGGYELSPLN